MSSTTSSSSSSRSYPRTPLHERSNSEKNKLASGIRLVPYSPPRLDGEPTGDSHGPSMENGRRDSHHLTEDPSIASPSKRKTSLAKDELDAARPGSALPSPTSSTTSFVRAKGRGVSGTKLGPDSSGAGPSTPTPDYNRSSYGSNMSNLNAPADDDGAASPTIRSPRSRRGNHIALHPDRKTFSIVLKPTNQRHSDLSESSVRSPPASNYSTVTSHDEFSFDAPDDDRPNSALSSLAERGVSPYTPAYLASTEVPEDQSASPWNYRMVGGLRKVATTPDPTEKGKDREVALNPGPSPLPTLKEVPSSPIPEPSSLAAKTSFNSYTSEQTESTLDENTNIEVLGKSSPPETDSESVPEPPSSSDSNYQVIGESSPAPAFASPQPPLPQASFDTPSSKNFVVHAGTSPATSSLPATVQRSRPQYSDDSLVLGGKYSQESLIVPPLKTLGKRSSSERFGYYRQGSRDSLRRANSFSSISSVITQDTASLFLGSTPNIVRLARTPSVSSLQQPSWAPQSSSVPQASRMEPQPQSQPHVWSSQLSTVMSEDERSDRASRHLSLSSAADQGSVSYGSRHSRQMLSISSSLLALEELSTDSRSHSRSNSGQFMMRGAREIPPPTIRDLDEHGDGLADLHELQHKGSRPRLSHLLNHKSSDKSLRSSVSSRAGSLSATTLPQWARIYYGSGERRWLAPPSIRSCSDDSRPASSFGVSASPTTDQFPPNIFSPRRRAREVHPDDRPISTEVTPRRFSGLHKGLKKMTSSLWSPHLEEDRRAHHQSMWQGPPSSAPESGVFGPRNRQVLLFAVGFIFPFAWMVAAFLPLPHQVTLDVVERDHSTTQFRIPETPEPFARQTRWVDNKRYQSARWWRNVNRLMSVVGLLVVGAIIALAIVGYWQNMKQS
ncbi:hypothetical protein SUNI508_03916 [Seiridium unicorne]|uniref:Serine-rich protein n=1 Tax=Seiridium unicorne TaxID=138068 RepID=A0ABR2VBP3_9PEZI